MTRTFRALDDRVRMTLRSAEYELLRSLRDQLEEALRAPDPGDPAIQRLFPPPVLGDAQVELEIRSPLVDALLEDRLRALDDLLGLLDRGRMARGAWRVDLHDDEPVMVLRILNDLRLAIGARLDVEALDRDQLTEDDPATYRLAVMDLLGWWQEQLLVVLDPSLADEPDDRPAHGADPDGADPDGADPDADD
ncbi:MAG: DUF2017 family protein [Nitriliruptoraceae bacterium]|nr:DUF2017 family protein [Nitriliruptoraceae bacterium]